MNPGIKIRLARLAPVPDENSPASFSDGRVVILVREGKLDRPIDILRQLRASGVSLRAAHGDGIAWGWRRGTRTASGGVEK